MGSPDASRYVTVDSIISSLYIVCQPLGFLQIVVPIQQEVDGLLLGHGVGRPVVVGYSVARAAIIPTAYPRDRDAPGAILLAD